MMCGISVGMGLSGLMVMLTVVAVLALVGVWLVRGLRTEGGGVNHLGTGSVDSDSARELLRRRFAAGEIDDAEYERRLSALTWWR
jgi:putative membrane protein